MKTLIASTILIVILVSGCASKDRLQNLDDTLTVLNDKGVVYSGTLEGPTEAGGELYSGARATTGGWLSIRLQSPVQNPAADYLKEEAKDEPDEQPAE